MPDFAIASSAATSAAVWGLVPSSVGMLSWRVASRNSAGAYIDDRVSTRVVLVLG